MFCIYCGSTLPEGATKCDVCGSPVVLPDAVRAAADAADAVDTAAPEDAAPAEVKAGDDESDAPAAEAETAINAEAAPEADGEAEPAPGEDEASAQDGEPAAEDTPEDAFPEELSSGEQLPEPQPPVYREGYSLMPQENEPIPYGDDYVYEEYDGDKPRKKRSLKWLWIALPIAVAVIATVVGIAVWFNAPMQRLTRALEENDYAAVTQILPQLSEEELRGMADEMQTYAETVVERYNNGETDYTTAYELLDRLRRLFPDSNLDTAVDRIEALNASKDAFNEAQYLEESGEAAGAISRYGEVIEDDTNYEAAQARIEAVRAAYKEQVLEEAQSLADSKDYRGAEAVLLNSSDVLGDDPDIAAKLEELQAAELDDYVEGLLKTAQGFADEGDYAGAIQLLEDATREDDRLTEQIETYRQQYKEAVLDEAAGYADNGDYESAVSTLEGAYDLLGDDADIAARIDEYEAMFPVLLTDLSPSGGTDCDSGWTAADAAGNSYGNGLSFALYPVIQTSVETEYAPGGQYRLLSGTWVVEGDSAEGFSATVRVYVDGSLQYEVSTLTRDSGATDMSLVIDGAQTVRIEVEGSFDSLRSTGYVYLADATFSN